MGNRTPSQTIGPFFHVGLKWEDGDKVQFAAAGEKIVLTGCVYDGAGTLIADAMVEESVLPFDVVGSFVPAFPVVHDGGHGCYARKCDEGVHVVGHQHEKKTAPPMARVIKVGGVEERASEGRCAER